MRGMTVIVRTVTALVSAFALLYGIQLVLYGHTSPGGGFAGGVVLACCLILMVLAFGKDFVADVIGVRTLSVCSSVGALLFLSVGLLGYAARRPFLSNFLAAVAKSHGGTILVCDVAIALMVAASLSGVFMAFSAFRPED